MSERLPPLDDVILTPEQAAAKAGVLNGPRGVFEGPFVPLLRSPALMQRLEKVGAYLRYETHLSDRVREFAIMFTARLYSQQVEWAIHYPIAAKAGVSEATLAALGQARRPGSMAEDEAVAWEFLHEMDCNKAVSDATYDHAKRLFGEPGVVDLVATAGYYALLGMVMNVARTPAPITDVTRLKPLVG